VAAVHNAPKPPPVRVSFTFALINAAANVLFVVSGNDKAAALREVLRGSLDVARLPAQGVRPTQGALVWLVDAGVAKEL
jgi:6-phosphogluconolactonase